MQWEERMGRRLRLRDLHTLQAVVEWGSMAKAADYLALSQPAISKAIADMEHALGVPLFDRTHRGVELTPYGHLLLHRSTAIFDELRQGLQEIEFLRDPATGELRIGSTEPMTVIVAAVIERLIARYPRMVFYTGVSDTTSLYEQVRERRIDLAIMRMAASTAEPDMDAEVLFQDPLAIVVGKQNPLANRRRVSLAELVNEPWTLPPASGFLGGFIVAAFRARGLEPPRTTVTTSSAQMWDNLLATGRFLGVLPSVVLSLPGRHGHLKALPIALPDTARPIGLVRMRNRSLSPTAHLFIEETRSVTKHLADNTNHQQTPSAK